ncbi:MAG: ABC transporter ATP-binding protein [Gammaproteobacteria bacterium]|nr:ABC transporter ATP-binding protein [Gammaproteobacteria bacterium]MYF03196.1 ABC transporter ATP-binding protein [Gammaproteobacteria bacterium]MYI77368.1 ABC transporter ATP-binding protein [Gammaproteobacteria bacterium]
MALVNLESVWKSYKKGRDRVEVLNDISFRVNSRDFVALMGPSGSGKTTMLNLIGGLDRPTSGVVTVNDLVLNNLSSGKLARWRSESIGFVFQFYNLLPVFNARQNVELPLLLTKLGRKQRKKNAALALDIVGLSDRARHTPARLSGGQQQRVAIARAIVADPKILVCDEPTGDLDRSTATEILRLLQILNQEHDKTIIMVTHDPKAAEYAKRTMLLDKGKLVSRLIQPDVEAEVEA